jgi:hypothetical protein
MGRVRSTFGDAGAGYTLPVIAKTDFTLASGSSLTQNIVVAQGIDSSAWVSGALIVRVHTQPTIAASSSLFVDVENISIVEEEPQLVFVGSNVASSSPAITNATAAGTLILAAFAQPIGPMVRVKLRFVQSATAAVGLAQLSIDLIGRPA